LIAGIVSSVAATIIIWAAAKSWDHRDHVVAWAYTLLLRARVRVSVAALLRMEVDGRFVVFQTKRTPGTYGPPGGVLKFRESARAVLDRFQFEEERQPQDPKSAYRDLRGFIPAVSIGGFLHWISSGNDRESSSECLRRELVEELAEIGLMEFVEYVPNLNFRPVRRIVEAPRKVPGWGYRQLRHIEVHDLDLESEGALEFVNDIRIAGEAGESGLLLVSPDDINHGRHEFSMLGSQTCYLIRNRKLRQDPPRMAG
jgi:8-oxo-dGTP pyrophosphatase MutT (NUDIX family)